MENEQQVISHEQALAALNAIDLEYADVPHQELVERYIKQQQLIGVLPERATFVLALQRLLNSHSLENGSNTPDFILASLLTQTLKTWELHTVERDRWWGNRSLLGVGAVSDVSGRTIDGAVPTSEKTLLPGVDITKPRDLVGEALGRSARDISFKSAPGVPTDPPSAGPGNVGHQGAHGEPGWKPPFEKPLDIPTGLTGAVNNLYCFHEKFGVPWITDEPTWPGTARMRLRRDLVDEECFTKLTNALVKLEAFVCSNGFRSGGVATQNDFGGHLRERYRRLMATVADGIVDSIYVLIGMGGEMGLDLSEAWRRVHAANMAKEGGGKREDGKILKPDGWVAPDVEGAIFK